MKTSILKAATTTAALVLVLGLGACGNSNSNDAEQSASPAAEGATAEAETETDSDEGTGTDSPLSVDGVEVGGSFSGTLDGEPFEIDNAGVTCQQVEGQNSIAVIPMGASLTDADVNSLSLAIDEASNDVTMITIVPAGGQTLTYTNLGEYTSDAGSAQVEVDGSTYTVTGEAAPSDSTETQAFDFVITCP